MSRSLERAANTARLAEINLVANHTYVAVAVGRDASDAAPIKAVFKGAEDIELADTEVVLQVTRDQ
jgi:uncharacterized alpha-E superfamily protein